MRGASLGQRHVSHAVMVGEAFNDLVFDPLQASPSPQEEVRGQTAVCAAHRSFSAEASEGRGSKPHLQPRDVFYPGLPQGDANSPLPANVRSSPSTQTTTISNHLTPSNLHPTAPAFSLIDPTVSSQLTI